MKKTTQFLLFMLLAYPLSIAAQNGFKDGTSTSDLQLNFKNMRELRTRFPSVATARTVSYVPICFHLIAKDDGTGRVDEAQVLDMLCEWNRFYTRNGVDIQFYIKDDFNYINKTLLFNAPSSFTGVNNFRQLKCPNALNIFMTNSLGDGTNPNEISLARYSNRPSETAEPYSNDWIILQNSVVSTPEVLARVSATFFGLVPTDFNSDCIKNIPFRDTICVPSSVNCQNGPPIEPERVARTGARANCDRTGDGFCDTPADYGLEPFGFVNCVYTVKIKDADCVRLTPNIDNLMSDYNYTATTCSPKTLSIEQINTMRNNYLNLPQRAYIRSSNVPYLVDLVAPTQLTPLTGSTTTFFNTINLDWENVNGATGYIVEVSRFASFNVNKFKFITKTSDFTLNSTNTNATFFLQGTRYYWRVRPFSTYKSCNVTSEVKNFTTGTLNPNEEIAGISDVLLAPNPLSITGILVLKMTNATPFKGVVTIFDGTGKSIKSEKRRFNSGELTEQINVDKLVNGLFILRIETEKGSINKRFVVQR